MADKTYRLSFAMSDGTTQSVDFTVPVPDSADVPAYWQSALDTGVQEINTAMLEAGCNKSAFLFYSDAHWTYNSKQSPQLLKYLSRHTAMTKTFFGGDIVYSEGEDYDVMAYLWEWRSMLKDLPNHHSVPGNHDDGNTTNNLFSEQYVYGYLLAAEETPDVVRSGKGLYYYMDSPSEKTRYLCLDTAFQMALYDAEQVKFVIDALNNTPDGWHVVAIAHIWYNTASDGTVGELSYNGELLTGLFDAYNARSSGTVNVQASSTDSTTTPVAYDFAACGGAVEFCIGGHTHWDYNGVSGGGIPIINVETDSTLVRSGLDHTLGTVNEASVSGVIADYDAGKITIVRVGRGEGRTVALREVSTDYTNQLAISTDRDGNVYNAIGYKENTRSNSSGEDTAATGWDVSGFIPARPGDIIRFKNVTFMDMNGETTTNRCAVHYFDGEKVYVNVSPTFSVGTAPGAAWNAVYGDNGDIVQLTIPSTAGCTFIRIIAHDFNGDSIVTINEEITQ